MRISFFLMVILLASCSADIGDGAFMVQGNSVSELFCPRTEKGPVYWPRKPIIDANETISARGPLFPGGDLVCKVGYKNKSGKNEIYRIENGKYKDILYSFYYEGASGSIQGRESNTLNSLSDRVGTNWSTYCVIDEINDEHFCSLSQESLSFVISNDGSEHINVGYNNYPGSYITVRVDNNKPISAPEDPGFTALQSKEIIEQLKTASRVIARYVEWPYESYKDSAFEVFRFAEAREILHVIFQNVRP